MNPSVEERLMRLERSSRRWRTCCLGLLAVIGIGLLAAAEKPPAPAEIIQAKRFELIDPQGHPAIVLQAKADGASLVVWGPDHEHAAVLVGQQKRAALMLMKNSDAPEVFAEAVDQGGQIGVTDGKAGAEATGTRAALNLTGSPGGFKLVQIVNGKPESGISFSNLGAAIELRTPGSKAVTRIIGADKGGFVEIRNTQGEPTWSAPPR